MRTKKVLILFLFLAVISNPSFANEISFNPGNEVVATVNGEDISLSQLEQFANIERIIMEISQLNQEFARLLYSTEAGQKLQSEYKKIALEELINESLLIQEADKSGVEVEKTEKEEMVDNHLQMIKEANNLNVEELLRILQHQGIDSIAEYKELLMSDDSLIIGKFLEKEVYSQLSVSDDEIFEVYQKNEEQFTEQIGIEGFEDVKERLKNEIMQQKQQQLLNSYLIELRNNADIEKNI